LSQFVRGVVLAADILGYEAPESELVRRLVQNIHPNVRSQLVFASEPKTIKELYALSSRIAEARAIEDRRKTCEPAFARASTRGELRPLGMTVSGTSRSDNIRVRCWKCSAYGHLRRNCPSLNSPSGMNSGNERGARQ
jgi:hypothetical protein